MKTILHLSDISASSAKVFDALTSIAGLSGWWTTDVAGVAGAGGVIDFTFFGTFNPDMEVVDLEPLKLVSWKCVGGHDNWADNTFRFELEDRDGATRLRFRQDYAAELSDDDYAIYNYNWGFYLESLTLYCETGTGRPFQASRDTSMTEPLHAVRFPGETAEYRRAREELLQAEIELRRQSEAVAKQRRSLPLGGEIPHDYVFEEATEDADGSRTVRLSELFEDEKDTLLLYSFMFIPGEAGLPLQVACPSCTSIIGAVDAEAADISQRINLAACAKAPIGQFEEHGRARGWQHIRLLSSANTTYNRDYHAEQPDGSQDPIATVFVRRRGKIHHVWSSELYFAPNDPGQDMRHVDFMWPLWNILDLTPEGRGSHWGPKLEYS